MNDRHAVLRQHPVRGAFGEFGPIVEAALKAAKPNPADHDEMRRVQAVVSLAQNRLATADPFLIQAGLVDRLAMALRSIVAATQAYVSTSLPVHIQEANAAADEVLVVLAQLNIQLTKKEFSAARVAAGEYVGELEEILNRARNEESAFGSAASLLKSNLLSEIEALKKQVSAEVQAVVSEGRVEVAKVASEAEGVKSRVITDTELVRAALTSAVEETRTKLLADLDAVKATATTESDAIRARQAELASEITSERQRLSALGTEYQAQFSTAQDARGRDWNEAQKDRQEKYAQLVSDYSQRLQETAADLVRIKETGAKELAASLEQLRSDFAERARLLREEMESQKRAVDKLVGIIGERGVTSGFQKTADDARGRTLIWQTIAGVSMLGLIGLAVFAFLPSLGGTFSWSAFAGRVFVTLTVGVLAGYAANQADKYLKLDRENRKLALELAAIGPFIAPLPEQLQQKFLQSYGERQFGQGSTFGTDGTDQSPTNAIALLVQLLRNKDVQGVLQALLSKEPAK